MSDSIAIETLHRLYTTGQMPEIVDVRSESGRPILTKSGWDRKIY